MSLESTNDQTPSSTPPLGNPSLDRALAGVRLGVEAARADMHEALAGLLEQSDRSATDRVAVGAAHVASAIGALNRADNGVAAAFVLGFVGPPSAPAASRRTLPPRSARLAALFLEARGHVVRGGSPDDVAATLIVAETFASELETPADLVALAMALAELADALAGRAKTHRVGALDAIAEVEAARPTPLITRWLRDACDYNRTAATALREAHRAARAAEKRASATKAPSAAGTP